MAATNQNAKVKPVRNRTQLFWHQVNKDMLHNFVSDVTNAGCAVIFGRTVNGSALSVCVLAGNDKQREYIGTLDDVEPTFDMILSDLDIDQAPRF